MAYLSLTLPGGQTVNPPGGAPDGGLDVLGKALNNGLTWFIIVGVILFLISIVWAGVLWAQSGGDKSKLAAARARITWSIIGLVIVFLVFFILSFIGYFFGVGNKLLGQ